MGRHFPATDEELATEGLAHYVGGDPAKPVVYEDFLPASAAGIFRSTLDSDTEKADWPEGDTDSGYSPEWMADALSRDLNDPYDLYQKAAS